MTHFYFKIQFFLVLMAAILGSQKVMARESFSQEIKNIEVIKEGPYWVSQWVEFSIPEGLMSFQILGFGSPEVWNQVTDLISPDGEKYVQSSTGKTLNSYSQPILSNARSLNRSTAVVQGMSSLLFPNSPKLEAPQAGLWKTRFFFHAEPRQKMMSLTIVKKSKQDINKNVIPVRVWISPESYWSLSRKHVETVLAIAQNYFLEANLELKVLSIQSLKDSQMHPLIVPQEMSEIALRVNSSDAINLYLMSEFENQGPAVNGFACIGGPRGQKAPHPCFVSVYAMKNAESISSTDQAKIVAHEISHYLGLFHTREDGYVMIGTVFDSFDDTDEINTGKNIMDIGIHNEVPHFSKKQIEMLRMSPVLSEK